MLAASWMVPNPSERAVSATVLRNSACSSTSSMFRFLIAFSGMWRLLALAEFFQQQVAQRRQDRQLGRVQRARLVVDHAQGADGEAGGHGERRADVKDRMRLAGDDWIIGKARIGAGVGDDE